jgi:TM2 domain-containing membrane protein YozV
MMAPQSGQELMRGLVLGVDTRTGDGIVTGDDGRRYAFRPADWAHKGEPAIGMQVDFEAHENRALSVFPVPGASPAPVVAAPPQTDRNKYVAAVLAFLLGWLGIHRFYLGRIGTGILMLVLSCTFIGLVLSVPWAFIDMIRYLVMSDREFAARYPRYG